MIWLAAIFYVSPKAYHIFELYRSENCRRALRYIHRYEVKNHESYRYIHTARTKARLKISRKLGIYDHCVENGLATAPVLLTFNQGALERGELIEGRLPARDLIVKPDTGRRGRGIERWICLASGGDRGYGTSPLHQMAQL